MSGGYGDPEIVRQRLRATASRSQNIGSISISFSANKVVEKNDPEIVLVGPEKICTKDPAEKISENTRICESEYQGIFVVASQVVPSNYSSER